MLSKFEYAALDENTIISVSNISKCFRIYNRPQDILKQILFSNRRRYYKEYWAVKGVSFKIKRGETIGIIGRNGSGKSTLLQIIAGILRPTLGQVQVNGRVAALLELGSGFNPEFTGRENIFLNGSIHGISRAEMEKRLENIIDFADIGDFIDQPVKTYSSGMFVRLAFAISTNIDADIIIIDEALAVGDEKFQRKCYNFLDDLRASGKSILFVSHSTAIIEKICTRALLLEGGSVVDFGKPKDIIDQYHIRLYSDEKQYLSSLNRKYETVNSVLNKPNENILLKLTETKEDGKQINSHVERAKILWVKILDNTGEESYVFHPGNFVSIKFAVEFLDNFDEVMVGIRLKTVEGIEVYGSSSNYHNKNVSNVKSGETFIFKYDLPLNLCSNPYFLSVAVAQKKGMHDMEYLAKQSDVLVFKVIEEPVKSTGIANLMADINWEMV